VQELDVQVSRNGEVRVVETLADAVPVGAVIDERGDDDGCVDDAGSTANS
jgi:hypothetical protein